MKIAIVAEPFIPIPPVKYGGIERVIYYLIKGLEETGHKVVLLAPGDSKVDCELIPICKKHILFGKDQSEQESIVRLDKKIRTNTFKILDSIKNEVDVIHSHGIDLSRFYKKTPSVTTIHGMFTLTHMKYYQARASQNWISISKNQQKPHPNLNYLGVVHNGLDPSEFDFNPKPDDYICFLGRFDREKNPVDAIKLALSLGLKIKLAGKIDFQGKDYFEQEIKPYFANKNVEFLGELEMEDKITLLKNAKCNIHPINFREAFGLTVLEAAYCGTPTLAINRGSMSEIIEDGRTGVLVEDIAEAYFKLTDCFDMDRNYISTRARALFNYENMASGYLKMYRKAIKNLKKKRLSARLNGQLKDKHTSAISVFWKDYFNVV